MTSSLSTAPDLQSSDYILVGVATCFVKQDGQVEQVTVIEPIPSSTLGPLLDGSPTSYQTLYGTTLGEVWANDRPQRLADFPQDAEFCHDFGVRAIAAARTYQRDRNLQGQSLVPPGSIYDKLNYSLERKRVLNSQHLVRTEDNVKQHEYTHQVL